MARQGVKRFVETSWVLAFVLVCEEILEGMHPIAAVASCLGTTLLMEEAWISSFERGWAGKGFLEAYQQLTVAEFAYLDVDSCCPRIIAEHRVHTDCQCCYGSQIANDPVFDRLLEVSLGRSYGHHRHQRLPFPFVSFGGCLVGF
jgi:hypothetical protein